LNYSPTVSSSSLPPSSQRTTGEHLAIFFSHPGRGFNLAHSFGNCRCLR